MDQPASAQLPNPGQLFSESWEILRRHFGKLLILSLIPTGLIMLIGLFSALFIGVIGVTSNWTALLPLLIPLLILVIVVVSLFSFWSSLALLLAVSSAISSKTWTITEVFKSSWPKLLRYWWLMLLSGLAVMGGFMLLIIPGILLSIWFVFSQYILIDENLGGSTALLKSKAYIKGRFLGVWGRLLLLGLAMVGISIVSLLFNLIPVVGSIAQAVIQIAASIFALIYSFLLFRRLKEISPQDNFVPVPSSKLLLSLSALLSLTFPILVILLSLLAINPAAKIKQAQEFRIQNDLQNRLFLPTSTPYPIYNPLSDPAGRDLQRRSDLDLISRALGLYISDHQGKLPPGITSVDLPISSIGANICHSLIPQYLGGLPSDPSTNDGTPITDCKLNYDTGYSIKSYKNSSYIISAPHVEIMKPLFLSPVSLPQ